MESPNCKWFGPLVTWSARQAERNAVLDEKAHDVRADGIHPQCLSTRWVLTVVAPIACRLGRHAVEGADKDRSPFVATKANAMPELNLDVEHCRQRMEARRPHCAPQQRCMVEMCGHM